MAYNKTVWVNNETPVSANNMNKIENELESLDGQTMKDNGYGNNMFGNDLNSWRKAGSYACNSDTTNIPYGDGWGSVLIWGVSDRCTQLYHSWNNSPSIKWIRTLNAATWSDWQQIATTSKLNISTANGFYHSWSTSTTDVLSVEIVGEVVHVRATISVQNSQSEVKISATALPKNIMDRWIFCNTMDGRLFNCYMGFDGFLYSKTGGFSGEFQIDFTYRKGD